MNPYGYLIRPDYAITSSEYPDAGLNALKPLPRIFSLLSMRFKIIIILAALY